MGRQWDITTQDIRFAIRKLTRQPLVTLVIIGSLALGIGVNAATFGFASALLLQPIAPDPDARIVGIGRGRGDGEPSSWLDYLDYRDRNHVFSSLAAFAVMPLGVGGGRSSDYVMAEAVTDNYFAVLDVRPAIGRPPAAGACVTRCAPEVVLGHELWTRRYHANRAILGQSVLIGGVPATIVGIAPPHFRGSLLPVSIDLWLPLTSTDVVGSRPFADRQGRWLSLIGRLKPGITPEQATADINTIDATLQQVHRYPERTRDDRRLEAGVMRGVALPHIRLRIRQVMVLLTALATLVLLIACANVASMTLARGTARRPEVGIRHALGASNARLVRQFLTESLLLACCGGVAGTLVAYWLASLLRYAQPPGTELYTYRLAIDTDARVWLVTFALSLVSSVIFGLLPAWKAARGDSVRSIRGLDEEGRPRLWAAKAFVVSQVALSLVLLVVAGLFLRSLREAQSIQPGFQLSNGIVVPLNVNLAAYAGNVEKGRRFFRTVQERVAALPGVRATAYTSRLPLGASDRTMRVRLWDERRPTWPRQERGSVEASMEMVDPAYFDVMSVPIVTGRPLSNADTAESALSVVIDESLARRLAPGEEDFTALLHTSMLLDNPDPERDRLGFRIVGIARSAQGRERTPVTPTRPRFYVSLAQNDSPSRYLIVRTAVPPHSLIEPIRAEIERVDSTVPLRSLRTLDSHVADALWIWRIGSRIVSGVGLLALALAIAGMYGVMAYAVARRTREIGIRMALGAQRADVLRAVIGQGLLLTIGGAAIGVPLALAINRVLSRVLYGVSPVEPVIALVVVSMWAAITVIACTVPALRAVRQGPSTLRELM